MMRRLHPGTTADLGSGGWVALTKSLKVRDRLMHPKAIANIEMSEDEITTALDGLLWFMKLTDAGSRAVAEFASTPRGKQLLMARALVIALRTSQFPHSLSFLAPQRVP
jgi:hypothetical protein